MSCAPFDTLNLGDHVEDDAPAVGECRRLTQALECQPALLQQVHGVAVVEADLSQVAGRC